MKHSPVLSFEDWKKIACVMIMDIRTMDVVTECSPEDALGQIKQLKRKMDDLLYDEDIRESRHDSLKYLTQVIEMGLQKQTG